MSATTTTSIKLDHATKARLQQLADAQRRSVHWLMREAIAEFVAREEQKAAGAPPKPPAEIKADEAYAWLAKLEAKGSHVKPSRPAKPGKWLG